MRVFIAVISLAFSVLLSPPALAVIETYEFDSPELDVRYHKFTDELRCPKCQNQNLSGSNSPIAADLRRELHRLLQEGKSDQQIIQYMVDRYGEFVLYRPRLNGETLILWAAPGLFLLVGAVVVLLIVRRQRTTSGEQSAAAMTTDQQQRLDSLLQDEDNKTDV